MKWRPTFNPYRLIRNLPRVRIFEHHGVRDCSTGMVECTIQLERNPDIRNYSLRNGNELMSHEGETVEMARRMFLFKLEILQRGRTINTVSGPLSLRLFVHQSGAWLVKLNLREHIHSRGKLMH
jgi:hypothetical protein